MVARGAALEEEAVTAGEEARVGGGGAALVVATAAQGSEAQTARREYGNSWTGRTTITNTTQ